MKVNEKSAMQKRKKVLRTNIRLENKTNQQMSFFNGNRFLKKIPTVERVSVNSGKGSHYFIRI